MVIVFIKFNKIKSGTWLSPIFTLGWILNRWHLNYLETVVIKFFFSARLKMCVEHSCFRICIDFAATWVSIIVHQKLILFCLMSLVQSVPECDVCLLFRCLEGSRCPYYHDWYTDGPAVVHLWLCQGLLPSAPPPSPWDARVPEEEARPHRVKPLLSLHPYWAEVSIWHLWTHPNFPQRTQQFSIFMSSASAVQHWTQGCYYSCIFKNTGKNKQGEKMELSLLACEDLDGDYSSIETHVWFYQFPS